jgi:hypothetical protein
MIEAGAIELLDAIARQQVAVGDQGRNHAAAADMTDDPLELRVEERLSAAQRDDAGAKRGKSIDPAKQFGGRHRSRVVVVLIAICTRQVAAPGGNQVRRYGCVLMAEGTNQHPGFTVSLARFANAPLQGRQAHGFRHPDDRLRLTSPIAQRSIESSTPDCSRDRVCEAFEDAVRDTPTDRAADQLASSGDRYKRRDRYKREEAIRPADEGSRKEPPCHLHER